MDMFERLMQATTDRARQDFAQGIVREPITAYRVGVEMEELAKQKGLSFPAAHRKLVVYLSNRGLTLNDFKRSENQTKLELVRSVFAE